jgi:hypothetical protein
MKEVNYALQSHKKILWTLKVDEIEGYRLLQFDRAALEKEVQLEDKNEDHQTGMMADGHVHSTESSKEVYEKSSRDHEELTVKKKKPSGPPPLLVSSSPITIDDKVRIFKQLMLWIV